MTELLLITLAGVLAGAVNTAIGSGSLITYPALLLAGLPPVTANVTNTVGLAPGALAGAWAFRAELREQKRAIAILVPLAVLGAIVGAALLLTLPNEAFAVIVPVLIIAAALLVGFQPLLQRRSRGARTRDRWVPLSASVAAASVYGGYFSAAQGIILLGALGAFRPPDLNAQNALKNLLQGVVNLVAAVFFLFTAPLHLGFVACIAIGSLAGAPLGAMLARRLPAKYFRVAVVVFGLGVGIYLAVSL